ncbi:hypothetical protein [Microbacterium binotii]|uniref:Uncharacterized protein n=2 Tax=Microbacterium TaxID=33882 RepID=A0ABN3P9C5_9MICO
MDTAVGLVQAYLRVNGYFTVAEYPVLDATGPGGPRTITDLDILAVRLHRAPGASGTVDAPLDPALGAGGGADMILGEVKEGRPHPNPAMRDPAVLEAAFTRFGCCAPTDAARLVAELLETGRTVAPEGHTIRTVVFGNPTSPPGPVASPCARAIAPTVRWSKYPDGPLPCTAPTRIVPAGVVGNAGTRTSIRVVTAGTAAGNGRRHRPVRMVSIAAATVKTIRKVSPLTPTQDTV